MTGTTGNKRIVVGIDGSPQAAAALAWAIDEARIHGRGLRIIHAFPAMVSLVGTTAHEYYPQVESEETKRFEEQLSKAPPMDDLDVQRSLLRGNPAEVLVDASRAASMVVVGSRGLGTFRGMLLGSVSMHVVHQAYCPVVVIREPE